MRVSVEGHEKRRRAHIIFRKLEAPEFGRRRRKEGLLEEDPPENCYSEEIVA
jgi:hypothetical protein